MAFLLVRGQGYVRATWHIEGVGVAYEFRICNCFAYTCDFRCAALKSSGGIPRRFRSIGEVKFLLYSF